MMENIVAVVMVVIGLSVAVFGFWFENSGNRQEKEDTEKKATETVKASKKKKSPIVKSTWTSE